MPLAELGEMAGLAARLEDAADFLPELGEPFLSPTICQELPLCHAKNPRRLHPRLDNGVC